MTGDSEKSIATIVCHTSDFLVVGKSAYRHIFIRTFQITPLTKTWEETQILSFYIHSKCTKCVFKTAIFWCYSILISICTHVLKFMCGLKWLIISYRVLGSIFAFPNEAWRHKPGNSGAGEQQVPTCVRETTSHSPFHTNEALDQPATF